MSYCVNCGVELEASQKSCPLCGVIVVNPIKEQIHHDKKMFPEKRDELKKKDRAFWIKFISILLAVPIATCVLSNLLYDHTISWSIYVIAGVFILWALCTSPFYFKKFSYTKMLFVDMAAILIGVAAIELQTPGRGWTLYIALPIVLFCFGSALLTIYLAKKKVVFGLRIITVIFVFAAIMLFILEILLDLYSSGTISLFWSWFVIAPCLSIASLFILLDKNKNFKHEMAKRLHF